jgi:hypothetical protein
MLPEYEAGDLVWVRTSPEYLPNDTRANPKLAPKWEEGIIVERLTLATYRVKRPNRRKKMSTLNVTLLKPRRAEDETEDEEEDDTDQDQSEEEETPDSDDNMDRHESDDEDDPRPGPSTRSRTRRNARVHATRSLEIDLTNITPDILWELLENGYALQPLGGGSSAPTHRQAPASNPGPSTSGRASMTTEKPKKSKTALKVAEKVKKFKSRITRSSKTTVIAPSNNNQTETEPPLKRSKSIRQRGQRALSNLTSFLSPGAKEKEAIKWAPDGQSDHPYGLRKNARGQAEANKRPAARK